MTHHHSAPAVSELRDLIARLEKATGPDRELDYEINIMVFTSHTLPAPDYTASIDAALTLVPEGWILEHLADNAMGRGGNLTACGAKAEITNDATGGAHGDAETKALALCAAALRAREGKQT